MRAARGRLAPALALGVALLLGPTVAGAQEGFPIGHPPMVTPVRSAQERIAAAEEAAVVDVERVDEGRITVRAREVLWGKLPKRFEVKRSPISPPPLAVGDSALLLLRGARAPYVLVDEPGETIRLADATAAARWAGALRAVRAAHGAPDALATVYLGWMDAGPDTLRQLGAASLGALFQPGGPAGHALRVRVAENRARVAADPAADGDARRLSAALATLEPGATAQLARDLMAHDALDDAPVVEMTLQGAAMARAPELGPLFTAAAASPVPEVREAAMRNLEAVVALTGKAPLATARELRKADPEPAVRRAAERALQRFENVPPRSSSGAAGARRAASRRLGPPGPTTLPRRVVKRGSRPG